MALKIRLRQQGRNNRPFYRVVVANVRSPRDGKYVEAVGWYNPFETETDKLLSLDTPRIQHWMNVGAELTEPVSQLLSHVAPDMLRQKVQKDVAHRAKALKKRKARKKAEAAKK